MNPAHLLAAVERAIRDGVTFTVPFDGVVVILLERYFNRAKSRYVVEVERDDLQTLHKAEHATPREALTDFLKQCERCEHLYGVKQ